MYFMIESRMIDGNKCYIFGNSSGKGRLPVFYWGIMPDAPETVSGVADRLTGALEDHDFLLAAYECGDWNDDFSPWEAPPVFGGAGFGGRAGRTLQWLAQSCIPYIEDVDNGLIRDAKDIARYTVGYSLAGLFSLWAYCESSVFSGAVSCSGSFWYDGFVEYIRLKKTVFEKRADDGTCIYLSLGDREEKTKNKRMLSVGDDTRAIYEMIRTVSPEIMCTLEWNKGGHFTDAQQRVAKGIAWVLNAIARDQSKLMIAKKK